MKINKLLAVAMFTATVFTTACTTMTTPANLNPMGIGDFMSVTQFRTKAERDLAGAAPHPSSVRFQWSNRLRDIDGNGPFTLEGVTYTNVQWTCGSVVYKDDQGIYRGPQWFLYAVNAYELKVTSMTYSAKLVCDNLVYTKTRR